MRVAILDKDDLYIGNEEVADDSGRIVVADNIDLPKDGSYKWDFRQKTFIPIHVALGKLPSKGPAPLDLVLYSCVKALGENVSKEAREWALWYEENAKGQALAKRQFMAKRKKT